MVALLTLNVQGIKNVVIIVVVIQLVWIQYLVRILGYIVLLSFIDQERGGFGEILPGALCPKGL
jgi:ABC-type spermidine/putrescine transport system permease subunit I